MHFSAYLLFAVTIAAPELQPKTSVGVVGAGAGGLTAAIALAHAGYKVTIYESYRVVGGHAYTHDFKKNGQLIPVDMGAQYIAPARYPNTLELFTMYGIKMQPWPWNFDSSLFGQRWSTADGNGWGETEFWKRMKEQARIFEDSMPEAVKQPIEVSLFSWCEKLKVTKEFQLKVLQPLNLFIMQTPLSPVSEIAAFFVDGIYSFFGDVTGWQRPGDGLGRTWEQIMNATLKDLENVTLKTDSDVTALGLCDDKPLSCSVTVGDNVYYHDYLVSGMNRHQLRKVLSNKKSTSQNGITLSFDFSYAKMFRYLEELQSQIPTFLHTDITLLDEKTDPRPSMYQLYNEFYTHNYLQEPVNRAAYNDSPLVTYKPLNGLGWYPKKSKIQFKRDFTVPVMSSNWMKNGRSLSKEFNGMGNLFICGGLLNGDYQESAVITALMVAESMGVQYPFTEPKAKAKYLEWVELLKGKSLSPEQIKANALKAKWTSKIGHINKISTVNE